MDVYNEADESGYTLDQRKYSLTTMYMNNVFCEKCVLSVF